MITARYIAPSKSTSVIARWLSLISATLWVVDILRTADHVYVSGEIMVAGIETRLPIYEKKMPQKVEIVDN